MSIFILQEIKRQKCKVILSHFDPVIRMNDEQPHLLGPMDDHLEIPDLDNLRKQRYLRNQNVMKVRKWTFFGFFVFLSSHDNCDT